MREATIARQLLRLARGITSGEILLAESHSYWQWEYDSDIRVARLYLDAAAEKLSLVITATHKSSGLGGGAERKQVLFNQDVGTLAKPNKQLVLRALAKNGHERSRAGYPFSRKGWDSKELGLKDATLADVIQEAAKRYSLGTAVDDPKARLLDFIHGLTDRDAERLLGKLGVV